ncbi:MAG TPA: response regulator transcription factor [Spirochaetia bacterium]|nr:response regulator transcription factor [Spirochaetia bacterium]
MIRVIICDDHPVVREGVRMIIRKQKDISLEEAATGQELLAKLDEQEIDVIILDIGLPGGPDGIELLKTLSQRHHMAPVLVMSMHAESQLGMRAIRAGASGYLVKGSEPGELLAAIRKLAGGGRYVSPSLAERLAEELAGRKARPVHEKLSDREYRVLCLLASGKGVSEIASELFLSPATVGTYRSRVLSKLNLNNTAELVRYAVEHGLLD